MNREELATLLAQTHGQISHSSRPVNSSHSIPKSPTAIRLDDSTSPLSPRQLFQSRVRTLSDDGAQQTSLPPPPSAIRWTRELQHLSSLRVHVQSTTPNNSSTPSHKREIHSLRDGGFSFTPADPDFVVEERAAWNAESDSPRKRGDTLEVDHLAEQDNDTCTLGAADPALSSPLPHSQHDAPLMQFGPSSTSSEIHDRPKTSRGSRQSVDSMLGVFPENSSRNTASARAMHKSKFNEGSMNERSTAVSSTWDDYGNRLSESSEGRSTDDTDSDATPRASSRISRDSNSSFDVSEFRPRPTTPSTIKNRLSKLGSQLKSTSEILEKAENEQKKDKRKGLRKSLSNWNFHTLGEKMRFFGNSTHDLGDSQPKKPESAETSLLNDRKRKAEEAYAQQFGTKKQKSNDGIPVDDKHTTTPTLPRTLKKRSTSAQRTITPATVHRRREVSLTTTTHSVDPAEILCDEDIDRRKRATRRELEKENQQLRAMLREQQQQRSASMVRSASKSSFHLPLQGQDASLARKAPSNTARMAPRQATAGVAARNHQKQYHTRSEGGVPPVPELPSRAVLANLGSGNVANGHNGSASLSTHQTGRRDSHFGASETGTIKRVGGGVPRPVSTILEGDEKITVSNENYPGLELGMLPGLRPSPPQDSNWQWPDDVF